MKVITTLQMSMDGAMFQERILSSLSAGVSKEAILEIAQAAHNMLLHARPVGKQARCAFKVNCFTQGAL